jgi:cytochrome c oxidase cbb3-type subunit III
MRRLILLGAALLLAGCNQEKRVSDVRASVAVPVTATRESALIPGPFLPLPDAANPYENNQQAIGEGQRLFNWYNCSGCHASNGGGGMGPPLIDAHWVYGAKPANIFETIVKGRPNGMPSWGGKIPAYQIWQLVTYIQAMEKDLPLAEQRKEKR